MLKRKKKKKKKEKEKRKKKNAERKMYAFLSPHHGESVTFFDVSTESLVLQHLLPDALIESLMSNRKRNKCFIDLELSLVLVGRRDSGWEGGFWKQRG